MAATISPSLSTFKSEISTDNSAAAPLRPARGSGAKRLKDRLISEEEEGVGRGERGGGEGGEIGGEWGERGGERGEREVGEDDDMTSDGSANAMNPTAPLRMAASAISLRVAGEGVGEEGDGLSDGSAYAMNPTAPLRMAKSVNSFCME